MVRTLPRSADLISELRSVLARLGDRTGADDLVVTNGANTRKCRTGRARKADSTIALCVGSRRGASRAGVESQGRRLPFLWIIFCRVLFCDLVWKAVGAHRIAIAQALVEQVANILRVVIEIEGDTDAPPLFHIALAIGDTIQIEALSRGAERIFLIADHDGRVSRPRFGRRGCCACAICIARAAQHAKHTERGEPAMPANGAGWRRFLPLHWDTRRRASGPNVAAFTEFLLAAIGTRTNVFTSANSERAQQAWGARGALQLFAVRCLSGKFDRETIRLMLPAPILMSRACMEQSECRKRPSYGTPTV